MKKNAAILAILFALPATSQADLLFTVGAKASVWDAEPTGQLDENVSADSKQNGLGLESNTGNQFEVFIDHPVPFVPDVRLAQTAIDFEGQGEFTVLFNGNAFVGQVDSFLDVSHTDATLVWSLPIPMPLIDVDFGITGRMFDGEITVTDSLGQSDTVDFDFTIPLLFGRIELNTPLGIYGYADANHLSIDGNELTDLRYAVGFDIPVPIVDLGLEAGYRSMSLKTDEEDINADFEIDGTYYGLSLSVGL